MARMPRIADGKLKLEDEPKDGFGVGMLLGLAVLVYKPDQQWPGLFVGLQRF